ncbi:TRAP transporter small permease [Mesorhizobium sp. CN2-181]|uniref:TRAP transporter small permease n=1 Tax=Mesorhizobium yinganensis TaxID=3157707 RepID=UPI0032B80FA7
MTRVLDAVDRALMVAVTLLIAILVVVIAADVVGRYGFGKSLLFANELSRMAFIWMTFLTMPLGISRGLHVAVTTVPDALPEAYRPWLYRIGVAAVFVLMCVVCWGSVVSIKARSFEMLNTLPISAAWYYYPLAAGSAWSAVHLVARLIAGKPVERTDNGLTEQAVS